MNDHCWNLLEHPSRLKRWLLNRCSHISNPSDLKAFPLGCAPVCAFPSQRFPWNCAPLLEGSASASISLYRDTIFVMHETFAIPRNPLPIELFRRLVTRSLVPSREGETLVPNFYRRPRRVALIQKPLTIPFSGSYLKISKFSNETCVGRGFSRSPVVAQNSDSPSNTLDTFIHTGRLFECCTEFVSVELVVNVWKQGRECFLSCVAKFLFDWGRDIFIEICCYSRLKRLKGLGASRIIQAQERWRRKEERRGKSRDTDLDGFPRRVKTRM